MHVVQARHPRAVIAADAIERPFMCEIGDTSGDVVDKSRSVVRAKIAFAPGAAVKWQLHACSNLFIGELLAVLHGW